MSGAPTVPVLEALAGLLAALGKGETPLSRHAMGRAVVNRSLLTRAGSVEALLAAVAATLAEHGVAAAPPGDFDLLDAMAVLAGLSGDPVRGATRFHHHRDAPPWADGRTPTALIGSFLYFRVDAGSLPRGDGIGAARAFLLPDRKETRWSFSHPLASR